MKGRKLLAGFLSAAMVLGTMSFPVFAENTDNSLIEVSDSDTLKAAVNSIAENGTIKFMNEITVTRDGGNDPGVITFTKNCTVDLNGQTLNTGELVWFAGSEAVTFTSSAGNGTIKFGNITDSVFRPNENGSFSIENITFTQTENAEVCYLFNMSGENSSINLKNCVLDNINTASYGGVICGNNRENTKASIENCQITNITGVAVFGGQVTVKDSTISATTPFRIARDNHYAVLSGETTITGGNYYNNGNKIYTIGEDVTVDSQIPTTVPAATIGTTPYATLADAVAAAQDGDVIDLIGNTVQLNGQTTIGKNITIKNGFIDITGANCTTEGIIYIDNKTVEFNNVDFVGSNFTSAYGVIYANNNAEVTLDGCDFDLKNDMSALGGTLKGNNNPKFIVKNCVMNLENPSRVITGAKVDIDNIQMNVSVTDTTRTAGGLNNHAFRNVYGVINNSTITVDGTETGIKNTTGGELKVSGNSAVTFSNTVGANIYLKDANETLTVEPSANVIGDIVYGNMSNEVITDTIAVKLAPTDKANVYDIVLDGNYKEIYEFVSAEIQFVNAGNGYQIDGTDDINVSPNTENPDRYGFYLKDGSRITDTKIKIGQVTFPAYGTINFKVEANNSTVVATVYDTNLEKYYTAADQNAKLTADANGINSTIAAPSIPVGSGGTGAVSFIVDFRTNGGSIVSSVKVKKGEKVIRPEDPTKEGYTFGGWFTDEALKKEYDFDTKVQKKLVLYAKWIEEAAVEPEPELPVFTDVKETDWFYESVMTAFKKGLMNGVSETEFAPDTTLTRAMLVTILYRAEGEPATNRSIPFADIEMGSYYANAVIWAAQNGIVNGTTETTFAPDTNITREQIATIIFRYAQYKGMDAVTLEENLHFTDADEISEYAVSAMNWAVGTGLMKGKSTTTINPKDNATRAEIAAILQRFIETNK